MKPTNQPRTGRNEVMVNRHTLLALFKDCGRETMEPRDACFASDSDCVYDLNSSQINVIPSTSSIIFYGDFLISFPFFFGATSPPLGFSVPDVHGVEIHHGLLQGLLRLPHLGACQDAGNVALLPGAKVEHHAFLRQHDPAAGEVTHEKWRSYGGFHKWWCPKMDGL